MVRSTSAQIGLLAFAVALAAGLVAGNPATVVLTRGLVAMLAGALVGQVAGWTAKLILREQLQRKKQAIDRQHFEALQASAVPAGQDELVEEESAPVPAEPMEAR